MNISIRKETPGDYRIVEEMTREAFWGSMDHPTCDGEHLLVHKLRKLPVFVPELDFVAEVEGEITGHIIYSLAKVMTPDHREIEVLNFGPLSVHPDYKRRGVGTALTRHSIAEAARLGYRAIIFYGHPDYYPRFGFRRAGRYGIVSADGSSPDSLMAMELYDGALDGITGRYIEDEVYEIDPKEMAEFEKEFPYKEPVRLPSVEVLSDQLPEGVKQTFAQHGIRFVSQLQRFSGAELLNWEGMDEQLLIRINGILSQLGQPCKLLPSSYILQLTELGVRNPVCSLIRSKAGISLYRVESEGRKWILKVFENQEDAREIDNYLMLSKLEIPTLPLLGYTKNAILLPDVEASDEYRLGNEDDLSDPKVARAIAGWYRMLHKKGRAYLSDRKIPMYDESDLFTADNMKEIAEKTSTVENVLWQIIRENYGTISSRIDALPRTLTYNDFYWTNLIVSQNCESAFMFDYNLLGKGIAYGDIRNVTSSLSREAAEAFLQEYSDDIAEGEKKADVFIAPLVTLSAACKSDTFPSWAKASLAELKNGDILRHLKEWLCMEE
ncbi:GNAT family N-acetyltransferase [Acetatifactor muris]|uniref:GNAT family N-acetyltransferase n=1 Tax=Acetatifactor muris TaxID=879566 RepID=UPI0023F53A9A|nr:GNAT family N-acetyltransferase [Acetatifactor muris]MCI8801108.1 GNAT family N-acetyltransferase [Lachnospiraceae bacterium]